jgi:hypothetical protein
MKAIDKFILHVVHNLFPLNEYSDKEVKFLMDKFKEEAEDLNIQVSDVQLKKYIERFDALKNSPKVTDKDLRKYSLSKLTKLITSMPGDEVPSEEEEDNTPDVVYNDNGITIWNGAKQGNCITYGASQKLPGGSKWCITEPGGSYFGRYRFGSDFDYPTFYLAKNSNLPDSDKLSFVSLQVLKGGKYKFTNRNNNPGMEGPFSWEELNNKVPWLRDIPNLKNTLKYIPFSKSEKESEVFKRNPISIKQWMKEPFNTKKQYLIVRAGSSHLFSDISNELFISKYLPQYPQIAEIIARTEGIINMGLLMKHLDKFSKSSQSSIAQQIRDKFDLDILKDDISFDLKKYLVKTNKIESGPEQRLYVTKDNQAIVLLTFGDGNVKVGLYTEEDDYPNIKLNQRTSKYLLDYPDLDKVPLRNLLKLAENNVISKEFIDNIINKAKKDPNSALVVKPVDDGEIILDSNTFSSYKMGSDGKITLLPFDNEEVQQVFNSAKDNESFQQNALNLFKTNDDIPPTIDKGALKNIINSIPYSKRTIQLRGEQPTIVLTADDSTPFFIMWINPDNPSSYIMPVSKYNEEGRITMRGATSNEMMTSYFNYLRQINKSFNDNDLLGILRSSVNMESKRIFARNNPPVDANNRYRVVEREGNVYVVNTQNPRESFMLSTSRNNLKQASISTPLAAQLLGRQPQQAPGQAVAQANDAVRAARRGRPAGVPNAPRPQQPAAPAAQGNINVGARMQENGLETGYLALPRNIRNAINVINATSTPIINNRGASRRQNILGNAGRVTSALDVGESTIYFIQLGNNTRIASLVKQPGNSHWLITNNAAIQLGSPASLLQVLQQRNLAEIHRYIVNEYFDRNPKHITEFKQLLRKHINKKKNGQK